MSHAVASCVCAKNMLYNQTSLKGFSYFSTIYQAFSINSVTSALLKPFIAISLPSLRKLYRSATHVGCSGLQTESLRETLTSVAAFPVLKCCDTSLTNQKLHLSEIKNLAALLTLMSNGWNLFVKLWATVRSSHSEVFLGKSVLKMCSKFTGEHPCKSMISIKCNFIEIALRHGCSPLNLRHIFRTPFSRNTSGWLLL